MVDVGDVNYDVTVPGGDHFRRAEIVARKIFKSGAMLITIGGDHGIPIPIFRALEELDPAEGQITLIQVDAHIDWRDERNGVYDGLSSPIRRASELSHIGDIFQIGMRAQGSARPEEVEAARAYGANIVTAFDVHKHGIQAVLDRIPANGRYYITIDADGLDPSICPAVETPCPGGLTYLQVRELIHGLVRKGRVVGMDVVEICPRLDLNDLTSVVACRLITNLVGVATRANYFEK
jgi:agmatinase